MRFLLELCGLAAAAYWGFTTFDGILAWVFGLGAPLTVRFAWGTFVAPPAKEKLPYVWKLTLGVVILSGYRTPARRPRRPGAPEMHRG